MTLKASARSTRASWIETNLFMQNQLLRDVDVMSMAHGIEIRVLLDREFVDLSMTISDKVKAHGALPKQLLIDSFKDILPEPVWNRPKMGFGMPFKKWLANDELVKELVRPDDAEFQKFKSGNMHWSQFLSLVLIKNRGISPGHKFASERRGASKISGPSTSFAGPKSPAIIEHPGRRATKKIMFLTLRTFSITGGIEKVSKVAGKAIYEWCTETGNQLSVRSMYDVSSDIDEKYFPAQNFKGFGIRRLKFTRKCVAAGVRQDMVILSHVNLLAIGYLIKLFSPKTKLVLIAHGIEVWKTFFGIKRRMLLKCDQILSVSKYTKDTIEKLNRFPRKKSRS